jgi:hypothetical protein
VIGEQAGGVTDRFGGRREGRAHRSERFHGGGAEEQPRASPRGSRELPASVQSSGRCQGVRRGTGVTFHGSMMAQWWRRGEGGKGLLTGRGAPFAAVGGCWQMAT